MHVHLDTLIDRWHALITDVRLVNAASSYLIDNDALMEKRLQESDLLTHIDARLTLDSDFESRSWGRTFLEFATLATTLRAGTSCSSGYRA